VLGSAIGELGEGCEKSFNAGALHLTELAGDDRLAASCAY
jgi:hypothetical protein